MSEEKKKVTAKKLVKKPRISKVKKEENPKSVEVKATENPVAEEVKLEASFIDDLGADSLDTVELVMAFEEEFEIEIPDEEAEGIQTVKNAVDYINSNS